MNRTGAWKHCVRSIKKQNLYFRKTVIAQNLFHAVCCSTLCYGVNIYFNYFLNLLV